MGSHLVSIIVNNYNYGRFLRDAIDSALAQTYSRVEVIVVDDGSTDDSREIIRGYGDRIIPVLKRNGGQGSAFNAGFAASRGDIVVFLDADDMLLHSAAGRVVEVWRCGVAKVQYWLDAIDEHGRLLGPFFRCPQLSSAETRVLCKRGFLRTPPTSGNAFSRSVLANLLPMPEAPWQIGADGFLCPAAVFLGEVLTIPEVLGLYRIHEANNWTAPPTLERLRRQLLQGETALEALGQLGMKNGFSIPDDWLLGNPDYASTRLESLRADPATHPYPADRRFSLMLKGVRSSLTFPRTTVRWRIFNALWLVFLAYAPRRAARVASGLRHTMKSRGRAVTHARLLRRLLGSAA